MPALDQHRGAGHRPAIVWALGGLLAIGVLATVAAVLHGRRHLPSSAEIGQEIGQEQAEATRETPQVSREELRRIEAVMIALDRRIGLLEAARASQPVDKGSEVTLPTPKESKDKDTRSPAEVQKSLLRGFDAALAADHGDPRDRRASEESLRQQVGAATDGKTRAVTVACATQFCRITIEQDFAAGDQPLDVNAIMEKAPALRTESMFDYQTDGSHKRTIVYAAREGQLLPMERPNVAEAPGVGVAGEVPQL